MRESPFWNFLGDIPTKQKLVFLFVLIIIMLFITNIANWYTYSYKDTSVQDILFEVLPDWSSVDVPIPNIITILQGLLIFSARPFLKTVCQIVFLISVLDIVRALTIVSTMLPLAKADMHSDRCLHTPQSFTETFVIVTTEGTCGDYIFSGHMVTSILLLLFTLQRSSSDLCKIFSFVCSLGMALMLIVLRWHYTDDVIIGVLIATLSFLVYVAYSKHEKWKNSWFYFEDKQTKQKKAGEKISCITITHTQNDIRF
mgnify:CR=1 FL=1|tara:strand:+ start:96 stop:863 length:768 start_codon:yes stop_codon:yes gene_type:complete